MKCVVLLFLCVNCATNLEHDTWENDLRNGINNLLITGKKSRQISSALDGVEFPQLFRRQYSSFEKYLTRGLVCNTCTVGIGTVLSARRKGVSKQAIVKVCVIICALLKIDNEEDCQGFLDTNIDTILYIIDNRPKLTSVNFCALILQSFQCNYEIKANWTIDIPLRNSATITPAATPDNGNKQLKIVHITDLHYDPNYGVGSNAKCDKQLCCQTGTIPDSAADAAGYWGDYRNCDTPWHAIENLFYHIIYQQADFNYIYFTGDIINHKSWTTNTLANTEDITKVYLKLKEVFQNVPIYPTLGNHEPHPLNQFSSEGIDVHSNLSTYWVFELAADLWQAWLPNSTVSTILRGGYYTVRARPGFRIIALNSNVCYIYNFWLLYDDKDPFGQLQWLADTLLEAERDGEVVHILSHIPSGGDDCYQHWSSEYVRIINRFSHVITAQFNGHSHFDDTVVYFSPQDRTKAINVAFNGGSFTTYTDLNPNYKVYEVNPISMDVTNFESWMYNITAARTNAGIVPNWYKLYDFKSAYGVPNLKPNELAKLAKRMTKYPKLTQEYFRYKHREADPALAKGCHVNCELENLCYMVTPVFGDNIQCNIYKNLFNLNRDLN